MEASLGMNRSLEKAEHNQLPLRFVYPVPGVFVHKYYLLRHPRRSSAERMHSDCRLLHWNVVVQVISTNKATKIKISNGLA